ncbi:hypothetical protein IGI04_010592, partial [Brassica rapa subsp. trilocularis]
MFLSTRTLKSTLSFTRCQFSPDKTNTPGRLALFVTVNAIANADALGDDGDELRRSNYRKIKLLSNYYCQNADCSSMLLVATKALAFAHNKAVHLTAREDSYVPVNKDSYKSMTTIMIQRTLASCWGCMLRGSFRCCLRPSAITPVPGGDGPMTIAILLCNAARPSGYPSDK